MLLTSVFGSALLLLATHIDSALAMPTPATDSNSTSASSSSASASGASSCCRNPLVRKEWRNLSMSQKLSFIEAIKCMQSKPAKTGGTYEGARSRYDDYQALHITQTDYIHFDGQFLPWHRYMLYLFEKDIRSTCGYRDAIPYWDWSLDAVSEEAVLKSPVFDPVYGFGGNGPYIADISSFPDDWKTMVDIPGRTGGGCVADGPFANRSIPMGPGNHTEFSPHCLRRDISSFLIAKTGNPSIVSFALDAPDFWEFDHRSQGINLTVDGMTLHAAGHLGVGGMIGEMANMYSSPGDPLFYLHHGMMDKVWDEWQRRDWPARKSDIGGPDTMWAYPYNYFGDRPYKNVTLDTPLHYGLLAETVKIGEVMNTKGGPFCYTYE